MRNRNITLNCDMGESFGCWRIGNDAATMPYIDMANIACGYHASDPQIMNNTIKLALEFDVSIGAHPSYPDLLGFGRRSMSIQPNEISNILIYQIGALVGFCTSHNTELSYVKPHGALYHDMLSNNELFEAVIDATSVFSVPLMTLASNNNQAQLDIADKYDVPLLFEAFADRAYLGNGKIAPRNLPQSVLSTEEDILSQVAQIVNYGKVRTLDGYSLALEPDTICIHSDNPISLDIVEKIKKILTNDLGN